MNYAVCSTLIRRIEASADFNELAQNIKLATDELGFDYFALAQRDHANMLVADLSLSNYPESYRSSMRPERIVRSDPHFRRAQNALTPFWWDETPSEALKSHEREFLAQAAHCGVSKGYMVPLHPPAQPTGLFMFALGAGKATPIENEAYASQIANYAFAQALKLHATTETESQLTTLQIDVLRQLARGRSANTAAQLLSTQPDVIHRTIKALKSRYRAATPIELVVLALHNRAISYSDVI